MPKLVELDSKDASHFKVHMGGFFFNLKRWGILAIDPYIGGITLISLGNSILF